METNIIHCGECAQVMAEHIPDESIDLVVTSPPYDNLRDYNGYEFDFESVASQLWRVIKPGGVVVWVVGDATINGSETGTSFRQALGFMEIGFKLYDTMIYRASGTKQQRPIRRYGACFEFMFVLSKGFPKTFNIRTHPRTNKTRYRTKMQKNGSVITGYYADGGGPLPNVWEYDTGFGSTTKDKYVFGHAAPFPEALARDHILSWSNAGDIVLDPMCGSGTTLKMAKETGRHWIGIDISQEYVELSKRRVNGARVPLPGLMD